MNNNPEDVDAAGCLLESVSRTETTGGNKQLEFADKSQNYDNLSVI